MTGMLRNRTKRAAIAALLILLFAPPCAAGGTRIKELAAIEGVRDNQLIGYGIAVGLNGTGDKRQTVFSAQTLANLLDRMGVSVSPTALLVRNMAAVMVTANLPPFAQPGTRQDVTVAAIGDATNLQGGLLLLTPLRGADGQVYAVAQGSVVTGGFSASRSGSSQTVNHPTVGRVPGGAIIEKSGPSISPSGPFRLQLRHADFSMAARIADSLNRQFPSAGKLIAKAESAGAILVDPPASFAGRIVDFVAEIEAITVSVDAPAKIVINERTGTIVLGKDVRIAPAAIMHGALTVEIRTAFDVSQPPPLSQGKTTVTPQVGVDAKEEKAKHLLLSKGASVEDLVVSLQSIGSTPRDVIAILQNLRAAGALDAEIEVI